MPLPTERRMRELYDWMERLLIMASELGAAESSARPSLPLPAAGDDLPKHSWKLFDAMARSSGHGALHQAIRLTNDRLAPIRSAKQTLERQLGRRAEPSTQPGRPLKARAAEEESAL